jgi:chromosome segregation ATPase
MALEEYSVLKRQRDQLNRAIREIDSQIRHVQRQLSRKGAGRRQQNNQLERVGLSTQINQLRIKRAGLSAQLRRVKRDLKAYDPQ